MLERLVQDVLEVAALDGDQGTMNWRPLAVSMLVEDVVTRYMSRAEAAGVTLMAASTLPDVVVQGDPARLMRALGELVENALTFTPAGGQVSIKVTQVEQGGQHWVTIAVHDTGPGISPQDQQDIFERFYRGRPAESGDIAGTGLGLSLVQEIMRVHGGKVTVQSATPDSEGDARGPGSTFTLWLPGGYGVQGSEDH
jgi:two-component system sensor histidine kinase SenX3